jgi:UDP-N-acetylglucosamine 2-epimerase (non-hydrolysing)
MPILYSCHPRSRNRLAASGFKLDKRVIQHEPLGFHDYNCLQMNAFAVVSDSGTLPEALDNACFYENVSTKVVKIIQSYTGIVNKMVWRKF